MCHSESNDKPDGNQLLGQTLKEACTRADSNDSTKSFAKELELSTVT